MYHLYYFSESNEEYLHWMTVDDKEIAKEVLDKMTDYGYDVCYLAH